MIAQHIGRRVLFCLLLCCCFGDMQAQKEKANAFYLEALRQQMQGRYTEAFELFSHALQIEPQLVGALYELSNYGHYLRDDSLSLNLLEKAAAIDTDNYWLKQSLVSLYMSLKREDDAVAMLESMSKQYPRKTEVLMMLADMYSKQEDYGKVIKTLDRLELLEGKSEQLSLEKFRNYVAMKDEKHAFAEMKALAEEYPNDLRYQVLIGDLYLDSDKLDEAYRVYSEIQKAHPDNINVQLSLAAYYQRTGQEAQYQDALEQVIVNQRLDQDTRAQLVQNIVVQSVQQSRDTTEVMPLLRRLLTYPQEDTRIPEICARYMIMNEAPTATIKPVLHQLLALDPESEAARNQLLSYSIQEGDTMETIRLCKTAVDYNSPNPLYYYYLGIGYYQLDKKKEALDAVQRGLNKINDKANLALVTNMYAISGDLYHQLGDNNLAYEAYDSCLLYRPDDALVLNNYAYYLSLEKRDLKRAEEMSLRSLEQEANNPTYLDTYAWILFQQRRYQEARKVMDSVLVLMGDSLTVADANVVEHAGDIESKCGNTERAVELWQQALLLDPSATKVAEKIRKRKYVE